LLFSIEEVAAATGSESTRSDPSHENEAGEEAFCAKAKLCLRLRKGTCHFSVAVGRKAGINLLLTLYLVLLVILATIYSMSWNRVSRKDIEGRLAERGTLALPDRIVCAEKGATLRQGD
jgi:hypothetical protein